LPRSDLNFVKKSLGRITAIKTSQAIFATAKILLMQTACSPSAHQLEPSSVQLPAVASRGAQRVRCGEIFPAGNTSLNCDVKSNREKTLLLKWVGVF